MVNQKEYTHPSLGIIFRSIFNNLIKLDTPKIRDWIVYTSGLKVKFKDKHNEQTQVIEIISDKGSVCFSIPIHDWFIKHPTESQVELLELEWYKVVTGLSTNFYNKLAAILEP